MGTTLDEKILQYFDSVLDFDSLVEAHELHKQQTRKKRKAFFKYQTHLKKLSGYGYLSGAYYCEPWRDKTRKPRYKKFCRGKRSSMIKKTCNRHLRRCTDELYNRGSYRKVTEFWWEYD